MWLALLQAATWTATPPRSTVGDTVWVERLIRVQPGWRVRPGRLEATPTVDPVGQPGTSRTAEGWRLRYGVVVWAPGRHDLAMPPAWLLGPGGQADSVPGRVASVRIHSVLPESGTVDPHPALGPIRRGRRAAWPVVLAALLAAGVLVTGWRARRRAPLAVPPPPRPRLDPSMPDARWIAVGEARAVAARARAELRGALARAVPAAHRTLSTAACLDAVARGRPGIVTDELRDTLHALDQAEFAPTTTIDIGALAARARSLGAALR
jgi:hypothetical protein